jgi:hypothetical protein
MMATTQIADERVARIEQINLELANNPRFVEMLTVLVDLLGDITLVFPDCGVFLAQWLMQSGEAGLKQRISQGMVEQFVDEFGKVQYRILAPLTQRYNESMENSINQAFMSFK